MMVYFKYLVAIVLYVNVAHSKSIQISNEDFKQIGDFQLAEPNQFPWQVSIKGNDDKNNTITKLCSGTLLSVGNNSWVITAAQCVANTTNLYIGLGSNEIHKPALLVTAAKLIINPGFMHSMEDGYMNDIALIKLNATIVENDSIKAILMPSRDQIELSFEGVQAVSAGWGTVDSANSYDLTTIANEQLHESLNWQEMSVMSNQECKKIFRDLIVKNTLCARMVDNGNINLCGSDFGAPLLLQEQEGWKIIAVASYTQGCDSPQPAVFSRMTSFMTWISEETKLEIPNY